VEQLVARRAHNPKVAGSNPAPATIEGRFSQESRPYCFLSLHAATVCQEFWQIIDFGISILYITPIVHAA